MCLIVIAWRAHRDYPLIIAANRDEFFRRPTEAAGWWQDAPDLLAGRDRQRGGTWLGVTKRGRIAMVTNYREPPSGPPAPQSRGALVGDYLRGEIPAAECLREIAGRRAAYDGFNLIAGDGGALWFLGRREPAPRELAPGVHGMSNGDLDAPWPKVVKGKETLAAVLDCSESTAAGERAEFLRKALFSLLADRSPAREGDLPDTGIGLEWERTLSPIFVHADGYGTRSSTVVLVDRQGIVQFHERSFDALGRPAGDSVHEFRVQ
jgi:uncharacterized protein with NRDE domain